MATKLVTLKNKTGDVYYPATSAAQVKRGASSTVEADLAAVESLAGAAIPGSEKGAASGVATLDSGGKIPTSQLPASALTAANQNVANIAALTALSTTTAPVNTIVFVADATGDTTVKAGWGLYLRKSGGSALTDWSKIGEGESLDVAMVDQTARDAASAAQGEVDALETTVAGLGTVKVINSGDSVDAMGTADLILEVTGTV